MKENLNGASLVLLVTDVIIGRAFAQSKRINSILLYGMMKPLDDDDSYSKVL
jgi:hypothetical protein